MNFNQIKYAIANDEEPSKILNEGDEMKVYGAGLLSSAAELEFVMNGSKVEIEMKMNLYMKLCFTLVGGIGPSGAEH